MSKPLNGNYRLISSKNVTEINAEVFEYEHIKTKAKLLYMKNDDPNKAFTISFRTPPEDSTGCPHIIEHSVLNGSKHYPAKNTFTELMKGSMKTFLNAFTASDKTMYPIASTNEQDFYNLMDVYLDAVFYPQIYNNADILKQEGWHYELFKPEDEIIYKGVVYNEMKGAFSSPDSVLFRKIEKAMFPDTPYGFESGGDPEFIPELSWEKFKAFHKRYYHPSNSWINLYGNLDIDKALSFIDEKFLSNFEATDPQSDIPFQKAFTQQIRVEEYYPIGEEDSLEGKNYLSINYTCSNILDVNTTSALVALSTILSDTPASPLKLAIQNSNLCSDNYTAINDSNLQPTFSIVCKHVKDEDIEPLIKLINNELAKYVKDGFDKKLIEAVINSKEFALREAEMNHFPKGLFYCLMSIRSWMNGGSPLSYLEFEPILAELRKGLTENLFEDILQKYLIDNTHSSVLILKPVKGMVKQNEEKTRQILADYKAKLSPEQINDLIADNNHLLQWQSEPDSVEDIAKIPCISVKDISKKMDELPLVEEKHGDTTLLKHPIFTNGIVYLSVYFDINHIAEEDLPWIPVFSSMLGNLDTKHFTFGDLSNEIDIHTGGISVDYDFYLDNKQTENLTAKFVLKSKCVRSKVDKMLELSSEFAFNTLFDDTTRMQQIIKEQKARSQMMLISYGHMVAIRRMLAQDSRLHSWNDKTEGMEYYNFLCELEKKAETDPQFAANKLKSLAQSLFNQKNLIVSITSPEEDINKVWNKLPILTKNIAQTEPALINHTFNSKIITEGVTAPVNVQFCAQGGNYQKLNHKYSGKMMVLSNILKNDFLMQELRVKGGAYGILVMFSRYGYMYFCSYRDPNLKETLETYKKTVEYLRNFECSERDFDKYIIGTMAELDMPLTPYLKGHNAAINHITNLSQADRQQMRDEALSTTIHDIRDFGKLIEDVMNLNQITVYGVETKIKENSNLFNNIKPVMPY